jgi:transcriptional regulator with XRE-family HTH domain
MKTAEYCAAAKQKLTLTSDYALAKALGVTRASVSLLINGHSVMSNTTAARIAEILELPLQRVIADAELERGSDGELWRRLREAAPRRDNEALASWTPSR